jgi:hypothetical protein
MTPQTASEVLDRRNAKLRQHRDLVRLITGPLRAADMAGPDARVLSYYDVLLRRADVDLLKGPEWLNDQVQHRACSLQLRQVTSEQSTVCLVPCMQ